MSTLKERLDRIKENFLKQAPEEARTIMHRATDDLRASGILDRVARLGERLPAFELSDTDGRLVRSADLLQDGPLVLTFYRGLW